MQDGVRARTARGCCGRARTARAIATPLALAVVLVSMGFAGCTGGDGGDSPPGPVSFPADPLTSLASDAGRYVVTVRTSPQPPVRGVDAAQFQVADGAGVPVDGLSIEVVPWMPAHGHGTATRPTVEPQGGGVYEITNVNLYMPGLWELRSTLQLAEGADTVAPAFDVR